MQGDAPFVFAVPDVRAIARFGDHALCTRTDFPDAPAWILTHTFADYAEADEPVDLPVPAHQGVEIALAGEPTPESPVDLEADAAAEAEAPHHHRSGVGRGPNDYLTPDSLQPRAGQPALSPPGRRTAHLSCSMPRR